MLMIWKEVSWSIWQTQQYSAVCKDTCVIYESSRVTINPVLHLWLKFQKNPNRPMIVQDFFFHIFYQWSKQIQSYCDNSCSLGGVNQMWILKNCKDLLEYIKSRSLSSCNSIKNIWLLYPLHYYSPFKATRQMKGVGSTVFNKKKEWPMQIQIPCLGKRQILFCRKPLCFCKKVIWNIASKYSSFFIDNIFIMFVGSVFQPMGSNCAPVSPPTCSFIDLFLYSYEAYFIQSFLSKTKTS
jgi:hypothetical protein